MFSQLRLNYALVTDNPQISVAYNVKVYCYSSYVFIAGGREKRVGGTMSWLLKFCSEVASVSSTHTLFDKASHLAKFNINGLGMCNPPTEKGSVYFDP